ncbi:unnamed protein product [Amoebophrya sp. A25]|nr:unnamed protein product [Amoebophrya sp. A25]|eukprot:GSA25T00023982001.1
MGNCESCFQGVETALNSGGSGPRGSVTSSSLPRCVRTLDPRPEPFAPVSGMGILTTSFGGLPPPASVPEVLASGKTTSTAPLNEFSSAKGRRRAVLIGINYYGTQAELAGCVNDVRNVERLLKDTFGWTPGALGESSRDEIYRLVDDPYMRTTKPTKDNILDALRWLVEGAVAGDALFLLYSGHGAQEADPNGLEEDGMNDTILPCDFERAGMISDDVLTEVCIRPLAEGVSFTAIIDACHSGTALDLPWTWQGDKQLWREDWNPFFTRGDCVMFSGCQDDQTSSDGGHDLYGRRGGALTTAFCAVFSNVQYSGTNTPAAVFTGAAEGTINPNSIPSSTPGLSAPLITYDALLHKLLDAMRANGFSQTPQMSSSQAFDQKKRLFAPVLCGQSKQEVEDALSPSAARKNNRERLSPLSQAAFSADPSTFMIVPGKNSAHDGNNSEAESTCSAGASSTQLPRSLEPLGPGGMRCIEEDQELQFG